MREPPPHLYFVVSAVFHYLGPSFAVLLFARVQVLGVAWIRIASAAVILWLWRRPRAKLTRTLVAWGAVLAGMNAVFYLAIDRLPLGTVAAIEFLPVIALAALGARTPRNVAALGLAAAGVYLLTDVRLAGEALGFVFAFANAILFALYIVLGHRVSRTEGLDGIDGLALSMVVALVVSTPDRGLAGGGRVHRSGRAGRRHRRGHLLIGDPLRVRPAGHGPAAARHLLADGRAAAGGGHGGRRGRAGPDTHGAGGRGGGAGGGRGGGAPGARYGRIPRPFGP